MVQSISQWWIYEQDTTIFLWIIPPYLKQSSPHHLESTSMSKYPLTQAPEYFQELMTYILKDFTFTSACLDDIIIFSRTAEHLNHIKQVCKI